MFSAHDFWYVPSLLSRTNTCRAQKRTLKKAMICIFIVFSSAGSCADVSLNIEWSTKPVMTSHQFHAWAVQAQSNMLYLMHWFAFNLYDWWNVLECIFKLADNHMSIKIVCIAILFVMGIQTWKIYFIISLKSFLAANCFNARFLLCQLKQINLWLH